MENLGEQKIGGDNSFKGTNEYSSAANNIFDDKIKTGNRIGFNAGGLGLSKGHTATEVIKLMEPLIEGTGLVALPLEAARHGMDYSAVILAKQVGPDTVYFWMGALKSSGTAPLKVGTILDNIKHNNHGFNKRKAPVYAVGDAMFSPEYVEVAEEIVKQKFGQEIEPILIDNTVLSDGLADVEDVTITAYQSITAAIAVNESGDLSLKDEVARFKADNNDVVPQVKVSYRTVNPNEEIKDEGGNTVRADFELTIELEDSAVTRAINTGGKNTDLGRVYGYIDFTPDFVPVSQTQGHYLPANDLGKVVKFKPSIVITDIKMVSKTLGYAIFGIACSLCMVNRNNLLGHIMNSKTNIGALNLVVNYEAKEGGIGSHIDLTSLNQQDLLTVIEKLIYVKETTVILDVIKNTNGYLDTLINSLNNDAEDTSILMRTIKELVGITPSSVELFAGHRVLPYVTWDQDGKTIDGREVDMAWLLDKTKDVNKYMKYNDAVARNQNATHALLELYESLDLSDASYDASIMRMVFRPEMIATLQSAILKIIAIKDESQFLFEENTNYGHSWLSGMGGVDTDNNGYRQYNTAIGGGYNSFVNPFNK